MAWVRIHDGALTHPRLLGIADWKSPFFVWVWGLSYCQLHLTDGIIPKLAMPNSTAAKTAERLVSEGLWVKTETGFTVRDYLQHNDSREVVLSKREAGRKRVTQHRNGQPAEPVKRVTEVGHRHAHIASGVDVVGSKPTNTQDLESSNRPVFRGQRIVVLEWMLTRALELFGKDADKIRFDECFQDIDDGCVRDGIVPVRRGMWDYIEPKLIAMAPRFGVNVRYADPVEPGKAPQVAKSSVPNEARTAAYLRSVAE